MLPYRFDYRFVRAVAGPAVAAALEGAARDAGQDFLPAVALAWVERVGAWDGVVPGGGSLLKFERPTDLDQLAAATVRTLRATGAPPPYRLPPPEVVGAVRDLLTKADPNRNRRLLPGRAAAPIGPEPPDAPEPHGEDGPVGHQAHPPKAVPQFRPTLPRRPRKAAGARQTVEVAKSDRRACRTCYVDPWDRDQYAGCPCTAGFAGLIKSEVRHDRVVLVLPDRWSDDQVEALRDFLVG